MEDTFSYCRPVIVNSGRFRHIVERPGTGLSDSHRYSAVTDWVADMAQVADALDAERLGVVGLSGGGPYALACGALPPLVDRVAVAAVLDGTVLAVGPEATDGGVTDFARRFNPVLTQLRRPLAVLSTALLAPLIPFAHFAYRGYARMWPEDGRRVLNDPEVEAIFVDDMVNAFRGRCLAMVDDARLLGRDWGFRLADVKVPVRWLVFREFDDPAPGPIIFPRLADLESEADRLIDILELKDVAGLVDDLRNSGRLG